MMGRAPAGRMEKGIRNRGGLDANQEAFEISSPENPLADLVRADDQGRLCACLTRLSPERREIIVKAYHHGMSREGIAAHTGGPIATVTRGGAPLP